MTSRLGLNLDNQRRQRAFHLLPLLAGGAIAMFLLAGGMSAAAARAEVACVADAEPNDTPETAMPVAGAVCIAGDLTIAGDQDVFAWTVSATGAAPRWTFELQGIVGQQTRVEILRDAVPAGATTATAGPTLFTFTAEPGSTAPTIVDLIVAPGRYFLGVAKSGGGGPYRLSLSPAAGFPAGDAEPNDAPTAGTPVVGAFALGGDLQGSEDLFAWTLSEADAAQLWEVTAQAAVGGSLTLGIQGPDGRILANVAASPGGDVRITLADLGFTAGTYLVRVSPAATGATPYTLAAKPLGVPIAGNEVEPNDDVANGVPLGPPTVATGRLSRGGDIDVYRFTVDAPLAANQLDLKLFWDADIERRLCLLDAAGIEAQCKQGRGGVILANLLLAPGDYGVAISGAAAPDDHYLLRVDPTSAPAADFEAEPNDTLPTASAMEVEATTRGRLTGNEIDFFRFTITGMPQLWRIEVDGPGVGTIAFHDTGDQTVLRDAVGSATADAGHQQISDLYLLPGDHWLSVSGDGADYAVRAVPLGPPDPRGEFEPNNDLSRAQVLNVDEPRVGRLVEVGDADLYRFSLAAPEHVVLRVDPPPDGAVKFSLEGGGTSTAVSNSAGVPSVYEALLPPGDYAVRLTANPVSEAPYRIALIRGDPFTLPTDREPNDTPAEAAPVPPTLAIVGVLGQNADWYQLPKVAQPTTVTVRRTDDAATYLTLRLFDGQTDLGLVADATGVAFQTAVPAATTPMLEVIGAGGYQLAVAFDAGPVPAPAPSPLPVTLALRSATGGLVVPWAGRLNPWVAATESPPLATVAAYWAEGQQVDVEMELTNGGQATLQLVLDAVTSHHAWRVSVGQAAITLGPGETATVPITVLVAPDAWADRPVQLTVRARDADGAQRTVAADLVAGRDAPPLNPGRVWPLPDPLVGGLNVAWSALGAAPVAASDGQPVAAQAVLYDGLSPAGRRFQAPAAALPLTLTVDLAGDEPVPVAGVVLDLRSGAPQPEQARAFDVLLSTDGITFAPVFSGELSPLPIEQAFVFDAPVGARVAQLRLRSNFGSAHVFLGEWKVVATPGWAPAGGAGLNVAAKAAGGHVVRADPQFASAPDGQAMLTEVPERRFLSLAAGTSAFWVVGFRDDRAARIAEVQWVDPPGSDPAARFDVVEVAISTESPAGPWIPLGPWTLARGADGVAPFALPEPTWARFVRFSGRGPDTDVDIWEYPATLRVIEVPTDDTYRSILGEWGRDGRDAIYEASTPRPPGRRQRDDLQRHPRPGPTVAVGADGRRPGPDRAGRRLVSDRCPHRTEHLDRHPRWDTDRRRRWCARGRDGGRGRAGPRAVAAGGGGLYRGRRTGPHVRSARRATGALHRRCLRYEQQPRPLHPFHLPGARQLRERRHPRPGGRERAPVRGDGVHPERLGGRTVRGAGGA